MSSPNGAKVTLVRGMSCSLVDIPTYLSSSVELASLTELTELPSLRPLDNEVANSRCAVSYLQQSKENIRRLRMDIVDRRERKLTPKKTQWTLICIALAFLTTCVTLRVTSLLVTAGLPLTLEDSDLGFGLVALFLFWPFVVRFSLGLLPTTTLFTPPSVLMLVSPGKMKEGVSFSPRLPPPSPAFQVQLRLR